MPSGAFWYYRGVTDKNYITNSYHIHVTEEIDAFDKLSFEAQFQELSPGGAISYVEVPNMQNNIEAVLAVMKHIYENIMYAELNTKSDYCQCCGYEGEIQIITDEHGKLIWECPNCGMVCIPSSRQLKKYKIFVLPGRISGNIFMPPIVAFHEIPLVLRLQVLSVAGRLYSNLYIL